MSDTTTAVPTAESRPSLELLDHLVQEVETVFHGKKEVVRLAVASLLARGHILFEDVPGVGKTTLSHALAKALAELPGVAVFGTGDLPRALVPLLRREASSS